MTEYRFHLDNHKPRRKLTCPTCDRRRCFTPYVDEEGVVRFPDHVGICDHKNHCGYHYTPADYFRDHPELSQHQDHTPAQPRIIQPRAPRPTDYIDRRIMEQSLQRYEQNPLYRFLTYVFGDERALSLCHQYHVGTSKKWGGSTVYWQVDGEGRVRSGKIMLYDAETGHRVKDPLYGARVNWVHTELKRYDFCLEQCLFGEHLLRQHPDRAVMLVESEKSALIASAFIPDYLWLATGGMQGCFNARALQPLRGRDVTLFPDLGAYDVWQKKLPLLQPICRSVRISTFLEDHATDAQRSAGLDIADYLLMEPTPCMLLHDMCHRYPALQQLIDALHLELIDRDM